jgi:hypothetical protein
MLVIHILVFIPDKLHTYIYHTTQVSLLTLKHKNEKVAHPVRNDNVKSDSMSVVTMCFLRNEFFWVITERVVVTSYQCFGTTYRSHPQGSNVES